MCQEEVSIFDFNMTKEGNVTDALSNFSVQATGHSALILWNSPPQNSGIFTLYQFKSAINTKRAESKTQNSERRY